jgi:glucuronate isomerase
VDAPAVPRSLALHPDRLLPADPAARTIARRLYDSVAGEPIFGPHGHVDAGLLADDEPFQDAAALLITPDHYVTRMLHALGVPLDQLGLGSSGSAADGREIWRHLCTHWEAFLGTPSRYWLESELVEIFGVDVEPAPRSSDAIYDQIAARLAEREFRPRALFERFNIDVLATTDDPASDLAAHTMLSQDPSFKGQVIPTFRPDRYLDPADPAWRDNVVRLSELTGLDTSRYGQYLDSLRARRRHFIDHGAVATDHGAIDAGSEPLTESTAERLHTGALAGAIDAGEAAAYRRNLLFEMARMSTEDGLVMQLHPGVLRNHHRPTLRSYGPDTGHDIPTLTSYAEPLRPLLEAFGTHPRLRLVLYTVDETAFTREIAPLAGFYPSVYIGAPWWFLDAPDAITRFRSGVTETAGFYKTAGFVDDTRGYCSIPARHDMSRRIDSAFLARLVTEHRITDEQAGQVIHDLVSTLPRKVFARTVDSA